MRRKSSRAAYDEPLRQRGTKNCMKETVRWEHMDEQKFRNELKFICSEQQLCLIEQRIREICRRDPHAGDNGTYTVSSVYFDDPQDSCYWDNINGVNVREKFRIRIYDGNMQRIALECKMKRNGKNRKESCLIGEELCRELLQGNCALWEDAPGLLRRLYLQFNTRMLRPKVIVRYERTPFVYWIGNVRITFDRHISGSADVLGFGRKDLPMRPVMAKGRHILEVKYDELIPDYIKDALQIRDLEQTAFSKYCICRQFS